MKLGTTVKNPFRYGKPVQCPWCHRFYTHLGISRHWGKCYLKPPKQKVVNHG